MLKNIISYLVVWAEKMTKKIAARNREENKRKQKELA
jgi:hypothetical protein